LQKTVLEDFIQQVQLNAPFENGGGHEHTHTGPMQASGQVYTQQQYAETVPSDPSSGQAYTQPQYNGPMQAPGQVYTQQHYAETMPSDPSSGHNKHYNGAMQASGQVYTHQQHTGNMPSNPSSDHQQYNNDGHMSGSSLVPNVFNLNISGPSSVSISISFSNGLCTPEMQLNIQKNSLTYYAHMTGVPGLYNLNTKNSVGATQVSELNVVGVWEHNHYQSIKQCPVSTLCR